MSEPIGPDLQAVLDALAENAANVCGAYDALIRLVDGDVMRTVGHYGPLSAGFRESPLNRDTMTGAAILDQRLVQVEDNLTAEEFPGARSGFRSGLAAPLMRGSQAVGAILIRRMEPGAFGERQIELLQTFANLAVIAIQNSRLLEEVEAKNRALSEALEREQATGDVLRAISTSGADLQPVLEAIADNASRLCVATTVNVLKFDGERFTLWTARGITPEQTAFLKETPGPMGRESLAGRVALEQRTIQIEDVLADSEYGYPQGQRVLGYCTVVATPMLHEGELLGSIVVWRDHVEPFTATQIALLETFAGQAAIAVHNSRLLAEIQDRNRDLAESLAHQTATADVLEVIASSPTDIQPVLDAIVASAVRLCGSDDVGIRLLEGDDLVIKARTGTLPGTTERMPLDDEGAAAAAAAVRERRSI